MNQFSAKSNKLSYKNSGVDISAGNRFVRKIKTTLKSTHNKGTIGSIGAFSALFDPKPYKLNDPILVSASDGVGTKLVIANEMNNHKYIGIDLVAMCVNDIVCQGARPLFFLDYLATGSLDIVKASTIIKSIATGCRESGCALIGGETAEMPGLYKGADYDLAGFAVGVVERSNILPSAIKENYFLLGLESSGLHSNGFSLIRDIVSTFNIDIHDKAPFSRKKLGDILLTPTKIYINNLLQLIEKKHVYGISHITGGGLVENIMRVIPSDLTIQIDLSTIKPQKIYSWIKGISKISDNEMLKTFNCGLGMVLVIDERNVKNSLKLLKSLGENPRIIGSVIKGKSPLLKGSLF